MEEIEGIDYITCKVCEKKFLQLNHRHLKSHGISSTEYKEKYNIKSLTCKKYSSNRENTFQSRYGVKNQFGKKEVRAKIDYDQVFESLGKTIKEKYKVDNISQLESIKEHKRKTCLDKYDVSTNLLIPGVNEKSIITTKLKAQTRKETGEYYLRREAAKKRKRIKNKIHNKMITLKRHLRSINRKNTMAIKDIVKQLGYTLNDLSNHLQKSLPNISWEEFINGKNKYSLDHIIPKNAYHILKEFDEEFLKCWNLRNLRITTICENSKKSDKLLWDLIEKYDIYDLLPNSNAEENIIG